MKNSEPSEPVGPTRGEPSVVGRILVVEDDADQRRALVECLEGAGHTVFSAATGRSAIQMASRNPCEVVLLDVSLPGVEGTEVCSLLTRVPHPAPLVIMVTGLGNPDDVVRGLSAGATDYMVKPVDPDELLARVQAMLRLYERFARLRQDASTDALTGMWNRTHLEPRTQEMVANAQRTGQPLSCLMIDIDRFKSINDRFGHLVGDVVLREVAARLRAVTRRSDVLFRFGGEEFAVFAIDSRVDTARALANRICATMRETPICAECPGGVLITIDVTVSVGCAEWVSGDTVEELINRADGAMFSAKRRGRNRAEHAVLSSDRVAGADEAS